jgi:hypothetical protein
MKKLALLLSLALVVVHTMAQDTADKREVTFSDYDSALRLASYDERTNSHVFEGTIELTGILFLEFDMEGPDRANGEINFQKFVPDSASRSRLPAVVGGFYPGAVRYVNLDSSPQQLAVLFGGAEELNRVSHGTLHEVSRPAAVVLRDFTATTECDSRKYYAHVISIAPLPDSREAVTGDAPHGC